MVTTTSGTAIAVKARGAGGRAKMPSSGNICLAIAPVFRMNLRVTVPRARPMEPNQIRMGFGEVGREARGLTGGAGGAGAEVLLIQDERAQVARRALVSAGAAGPCPVGHAIRPRASLVRPSRVNDGVNFLVPDLEDFGGAPSARR